jgi:hypothetical protein
MTQAITTENKICTKCAVSKSASDFYVDSRRGYLRGKCKDCLKQEDKAYRIANPEKKAEQVKKWRDANPDKAKIITKRHFEKNRDAMYQRTAKWREANREYCSQLTREWAKNNPSKASANASKRRAKLLNATPVWADFAAIQVEYDLADWCSKATGIKYHVDHIVPLQGKTICGLHVPNNLQVIPAKDNHVKHNKFTAI